MKSSSTRAALGLVACLLVASVLVSACDSTAQEMAVRMRMQQLINMFPSVYEDIRSGRLVPNRPNYQGGLNGFQNGQVLPNGQQFVPQGQQFVPQGQQFIPQQGQQVLPNGQILVPANQGQVVPNTG